MQILLMSTVLVEVYSSIRFLLIFFGQTLREKYMPAYLEYCQV